MIKTLSSLTLSLILFSGVESFAQQTEKPEPPAATPEKEATPVRKSNPETEIKKKDNKAPDIFVPSEEISEDLSVSFPEDI